VKFQGNKLQERLRQQRERVTLIESDGRERKNITPHCAADIISGREFIGYGKNGVIEFVKAVGAPRRGPFVVAADIRSLLRDFPRLRTASRSAQQGLEWRQQPAASKNGRSTRVLTVHFRRGLQWV
jgi:hypothetical protein